MAAIVQYGQDYYNLRPQQLGEVDCCLFDLLLESSVFQSVNTKFQCAVKITEYTHSNGLDTERMICKRMTISQTNFQQCLQT